MMPPGLWEKQEKMTCIATRIATSIVLEDISMVWLLRTKPSVWLLCTQPPAETSFCQRNTQRPSCMVRVWVVRIRVRFNRVVRCTHGKMKLVMHSRQDEIGNALTAR